ncbi:MAG: endo-1,4-beta-xylanase [Sedimentisphaerales bacterium]|nr:endo-1,4-beta-xylanase [Sedimentisphaerales bacterium]
MIRFQIYHKGQQATDIANGAYFFAQDEIPVRSQVSVEGTELIGVRSSDTAIGLVTLWEVEGFGKILLQTTRLPERGAPYNLNVELARGKLLRISQKREEWGMADLNLSVEVHGQIDQALDQFVTALGMPDQPDQAGKYADEALSLAVPAGEAMALEHARMFLQRRGATQGFGRHSFACSIDLRRMNDPVYQQFIKDHFHFVTVPATWKLIEPKEQEENYEQLDECIRWLSHNRIAVKVGPLLNFSPLSAPDWLFIWENDFEQVREMAYEFVTKTVQRYGEKVQAWDVVSGLNAENVFKFSFEQIIEMTRSAALAAKRASSRSLVLVEITEPWGGYYAFNHRTIPPLIYADMLCQSGVMLDGFGLRLRFGRGAAGMPTRDLLEVAALLDRFAIFGKPIHLSGVQVPSVPDPRDNQGHIGEAGYWHGGWTEVSQSEWLECLYQIGLSRPYIETITWQDLADTDDAVLQHGGLTCADLTPKPAFEKFYELKKALSRPSQSRSASHKAKPTSPSE